MVIAQEKRKTNIAEYVLYMWQIEDMIRAYNFNIDLIDTNIISLFNRTETKKKEIRNWYANLIVMMHEEEIREKGHLALVKGVISQMNDLHIQILQKKEDAKYLEIYKLAERNIFELKEKLPEKDISDVETCLDGLYGLLLMRLKKREVTDETSQAMTTFSNFLAILAQRFKQWESGELEL